MLKYVDDNSPPVVWDVWLGELDGTMINAMFSEHTSEQPAVISIILKWDVRVCSNHPHHKRQPPEFHEALWSHNLCLNVVKINNISILKFIYCRNIMLPGQEKICTYESLTGLAAQDLSFITIMVLPKVLIDISDQ